MDILKIKRRNIVFYNTGIVHVEGSYFLLVVSQILSFDDSEPMIPGCSDECPIKHKHIESTNHPWKDLWEGLYRTSSSLILWNSKENKFSDLKDLYYSRNFGMKSDQRLYHFNGDIYLIDTDLERTWQVEINTKDLAKQCELQNSFKECAKLGKNLVVLQYNKGTIQFIDWWKNEGLYYCSLKDNRELDEIQTRIVNFRDPQKTGFLGKGSCLNDKEENIKVFGESNVNTGRTPSFCFNVIKLLEETGGIKTFIGLAHLKILNNPDAHPYAEGNLQTFRKNFLDQFSSHFGDDFVPHYSTRLVSHGKSSPIGFIYLNVFVLITMKGDEISKILIGDPHFPMSFDIKGRRSTVFFSAGIEIDPNVEKGNLIVTGGLDDLHPVILRYDLEVVKSNCRHDALNLNFDDLAAHFYIRAVKGDKVYTGKTLSEITSLVYKKQ